MSKNKVHARIEVVKKLIIFNRYVITITDGKKSEVYECSHYTITPLQDGYVLKIVTDVGTMPVYDGNGYAQATQYQYKRIIVDDYEIVEYRKKEPNRVEYHWSLFRGHEIKLKGWPKPSKKNSKEKHWWSR